MNILKSDKTFAHSMISWKSCWNVFKSDKISSSISPENIFKKNGSFFPNVQLINSNGEGWKRVKLRGKCKMSYDSHFTIPYLVAVPAFSHKISIAWCEENEFMITFSQPCFFTISNLRRLRRQINFDSLIYVFIIAIKSQKSDSTETKGKTHLEMPWLRASCWSFFCPVSPSEPRRRLMMENLWLRPLERDWNFLKFFVVINLFVTVISKCLERDSYKS